MSDKRTENRHAERVRIRRLYEDELANPGYYDEIEHALRKSLPGFEVIYAPNETLCKWNGPNGNRFVVRGETRGDALLKLWWKEMPVEF